MSDLAGTVTARVNCAWNWARCGNWLTHFSSSALIAVLLTPVILSVMQTFEQSVPMLLQDKVTLPAVGILAVYGFEPDIFLDCLPLSIYTLLIAFSQGTYPLFRRRNRAAGMATVTPAVIPLIGVAVLLCLSESPSWSEVSEEIPPLLPYAGCAFLHLFLWLFSVHAVRSFISLEPDREIACAWFGLSLLGLLIIVYCLGVRVGASNPDLSPWLLFTAALAISAYVAGVIPDLILRSRAAVQANERDSALAQTQPEDGTKSP